MNLTLDCLNVVCIDCRTALGEVVGSASIDNFNTPDTLVNGTVCIFLKMCLISMQMNVPSSVVADEEEECGVYSEGSETSEGGRADTDDEGIERDSEPAPRRRRRRRPPVFGLRDVIEVMTRFYFEKVNTKNARRVKTNSRSAQSKPGGSSRRHPRSLGDHEGQITSAGDVSVAVSRQRYNFLVRPGESRAFVTKTSPAGRAVTRQSSAKLNTSLDKDSLL
ncbi:hypothetical protein EVAR_38423_1 [Eumeta japonica]|uniref:Uncharacterized protein n=1 Tax=Eumeta variegata TaxID=151549 RepID=A0A4C1WWC1_EUMVA|nr:hypothetical protein EVAR_38423_1 [Eumeta japonica]